jgi:hypothetical protein
MTRSSGKTNPPRDASDFARWNEVMVMSARIAHELRSKARRQIITPCV